MARDSESPDYVQQLRGRLFLKTTLTRAALSNTILSVLEPAVRNVRHAFTSSSILSNSLHISSSSTRSLAYGP